MRQRVLLGVLAVLLAGCFGVGGPVVVDTTTSARLPIRIKRDLFLTTVRINGVERGPFVVDTGASGLFVDVELAEALRLTFSDQATAPELQQVVKFGTVRTLEVGPVVFRDARVGVGDLSRFTDSLGEKPAGLLGHPFFAKLIVEIDYVRRTVACFDPTTYRLPGGHWRPLRSTGGLPGVSAFRPFGERHRGLDIRDVRQNISVPAWRQHDTLSGLLSSFELGGRRFDGAHDQL